MEVKDGYLRRATLLALLALREQPRVAAGGQLSAGHHPAGQVGGQSVGHAGHPSGHPSVGHHQQGHSAYRLISPCLA